MGNLSHPVFGDSPVPRYVQLADVLRERIVRGALTVGTRIQTLEELGREFSVARITARQAVTLLAREGLLSAYRGRGTFVTGQPKADRTLRLETSLRSLAAVYQGDRPQLTLIDEETAALPDVEAEFGRPAPHYRFLRRVHSREGRAYCVISLHLDERVFRLAPKRFRNETVIAVLLDLPQVKIAKARQTLTISIADIETAHYLGVAVNAPTAVVRRIFSASDGTIVYLGVVTYHSDYVRIEMDLKP